MGAALLAAAASVSARDKSVRLVPVVARSGAAIATQSGAATAAVAGAAEARLMEVYRLTAQGQNREALLKAEGLVNDYPTFLLAQLVFHQVWLMHLHKSLYLDQHSLWHFERY